MDDLTTMLAALWDLEAQVCDTAGDVTGDPDNQMRWYDWRPQEFPELPALWNWIEPSDMVPVDTARDDDLIIVTVSIGVQPSDSSESIEQLVKLVDHFRNVVDPVLKNRPILPDSNGDPSARSARRIITRTNWEEFDGAPVFCMDMLLRIQLSKFS